MSCVTSVLQKNKYFKVLDRGGSGQGGRLAEEDAGGAGGDVEWVGDQGCCAGQLC